MIFALHYANLFYRTNAKGEHGGLLFPGDREPDYRDFLYYAFVIACAEGVGDSLQTPPRQRASRQNGTVRTALCVMQRLYGGRTERRGLEGLLVPRRRVRAAGSELPT